MRVRAGPPPHSTPDFRVWFDLARAGNFPSVASNVLAALVLARVVDPAWPAPGLLALAIAAGCLVYAGGATFNDVVDATFDAQRRPERAIPRGAVSCSTAAAVAAGEMTIGAGVLLAIGASATWTVALVATILVYDWIHKRWVGTIVLMAGCRVLLACVVASLPDREMTPAFLGWIAALFVYVATLSLVARWEYRPGAPAAKLGRTVGRLLAFIPLVDAAALLCVGAWGPAVVCAAAIPLGRWAQRIAAST